MNCPEEELRLDGTCRVAPHLVGTYLHPPFTDCYSRAELLTLGQVIRAPSAAHDDKHERLACFIRDMRHLARNESIAAGDIMRVLGMNHSLHYDHTNDTEWHAIVAENHRLAMQTRRQLHFDNNPYMRQIVAARRELDAVDPYGAIVMLIVDMFSLFMSFLGLASLGAKAGAFMASKLSSAGRMAIREMMMALKISDGSIPSLVSALPKLIKAVFSQSKMTGSTFINYLSDNMHWYDWALDAISIILTVGSFFLTGGAAFAATLASASTSVYAIFKDGKKIHGDCQDPEAAAREVDVAQVVGARKKADGDPCNDNSECFNGKCGKTADYRQMYCCPYGYDEPWYSDEHYCLGILDGQPCEHNFQCEHDCDDNTCNFS